MSLWLETLSFWGVGALPAAHQIPFYTHTSSVNSQILYNSSEDYRSLPNASVMRFEELPFEKKLTTLELAQLNASFF